MSRNEVAAPQRLSFKTKFFFGLGSAAEAIGLFSVTSYAMLYYNQVLGLPAHLAGLALSASLLLDGPCDLLMGSLSDRTRSRFGRRHLYMYIAPIPIGLALIAVFNPPRGAGETLLFVWFTISVILLRQLMNLFHTPHSALGGELTTDYSERTKVMAYASFFTSAGATAQGFIALTFFFKATPDYPRGLLNPEPWMRYSLTMAALAVIMLYASSWYTRDRIPHLPRPPANLPRFSAAEFLRDVGKAFSNLNYSLLIAGYFLLTMTTGLRSGLQLYTNTYFWGLTSETLRWLIFASLLGAVVAFVVTARLQQRFDKKATIIVASVIQAIAPAIPTWLGLLGVLTPQTPNLPYILLAASTIGWIGYGVLTIGVLSCMADVADENDLRYGVRQEGVMYAMRNMFGKIDQAIGAALAGGILTLVAFPIKAVVGQVPLDVVRDVAWADGVLATIPGVLAVIPYLFYRINRAQYETTKAALAARGAKAAPPSTPRAVAEETSPQSVPEAL